MSELPRAYDAHAAADRYYSWWEESGFFTGDPDHPGKGFCIVIPPPNVTGSLHMGHALDNTLQDILIRYKRMDGFAALWIPGTDHAGIATQMVVDRKLRAEGIDRHELAASLAATAEGLTGADIAFVCQRAVLLCVKAAALTPDDLDIAITADHLREAVALVTRAPTSVAGSSGRRLRTAG